MAETDWLRIAIETTIAAGSGLSGAIASAWRLGRAGGEERAAIKLDYDTKIEKVREENAQAMAKALSQAEARNELLVEQFKETLEGLRRQFDEQRVHIERDFLRKDTFNEWRQEYREDIREIKDMIADRKRQ